GDLFVADTSSNEVIKSSPPYSTYSVFLGPASFPACTSTNDDGGATVPFCLLGVAVNAAGHVFVGHGDAHAVFRFDSAGAPQGPFASVPPTLGPTFMQFDALGNLWLGAADLMTGSNGAVYRVAPDSTTTLVASMAFFAPIGMALPLPQGN